jgi:predicted nucleic acid-binding protein
VILADTTVWIDFLAGRASALPLRSLLASNRVVCHPAVRGEMALGSLANRDDVLRLLSQLPSAPVAGDDDVFALIDAKKLYASGIGWIDAHLLASSIAGGHTLWTGDKRLAGVAARSHVLADPATLGSK